MTNYVGGGAPITNPFQMAGGNVNWITGIHHVNCPTMGLRSPCPDAGLWFALHAPRHVELRQPAGVDQCDPYRLEYRATQVHSECDACPLLLRLRRLARLLFTKSYKVAQKHEIALKDTETETSETERQSYRECNCETGCVHLPHLAAKKTRHS